MGVNWKSYKNNILLIFVTMMWTLMLQYKINLLTFLGWNSYLTQCWNTVSFVFSAVNTKQLPRKCAWKPLPVLEVKLPKKIINRHLTVFFYKKKLREFMQTKLRALVPNILMIIISAMWYKIYAALVKQIYNHLKVGLRF